MATLDDLINNEAEMDDEEDDESFDEETGETRRKERDDAEMDDSSEEEDDDDDEEAAAEVRRGFIVDEDEDEEEEGEDDVKERKRRRKRRRADREEEEQLDEEDLDLIGEAHPDWERKAAAQPKFKRLKHGRDEDHAAAKPSLNDMFSDDDDEAGEERPYRQTHRAAADEFDDFIEDDYPEDDDERLQRQEDLEVARPRDRLGFTSGALDTSGLDKDALEDWEKIFGDGQEYAWALEQEEINAEDKQQDNIELRDVFEPSQLKAKLLTDEDNYIRNTDIPERFQTDRSSYKHLQFEDADSNDESIWIANLIWPTKGLSSDLRSPFTKAIHKVLEFFTVEGFEVPFVFQHRKDYLIHMRRIRNPDRNRDDPDDAEYINHADKLLTQDDLWRVLELDIRFRSLMDKRRTMEKSLGNLRAQSDVQDALLEDMIAVATSNEELQDLQDYMQFQYGAELKDIAATTSTAVDKKRAGAKSTSTWDKIRKSKIYAFVKAYGISPNRLAQNLLKEGTKVSAEDEEILPIDLADALTDGDFPTGDSVISNARQMYAEELFVSPKMRKYLRAAFYTNGLISCRRTDKGMRKIDELHPYYEIKYLVNQSLSELARRPELFLKMMKAEEDGLVEINLALQNEREFRRGLYNEFVSDNFSERADAWNEERDKVLGLALAKLQKVVAKGVKDSLKIACQDELLKTCREQFLKRLDQAPYKPKGLVLGTTPRVLALSCGGEDPARDPIYWVYVDDDGRVVEEGKFTNLGRDEQQRDAFVELTQKRVPDVIGVSGWSAGTPKLVKDLENLVSEKAIMGVEYHSDDDKEYRADLLEVIVVNDEVARLYKDGERALADYPNYPSVTRYCAALGRYLQNPMLEYAAMKKDVITLSFHPSQHLLPPDKLLKCLESALVDMVNLCGVNINEAVSDPYVANLVPYISGLGPRKATNLMKGIAKNGGFVTARDELVGDPDEGKIIVLGPSVWANCASFLVIDYDRGNPNMDPLDNTRVHPEDYDLGRKMAADALELDEEDVKAETDENGPSAIIRRMFREDETDRVNELILEEYAEQLERNYNQRKRATLETIRAELQNPYEELRRHFATLGSDEIFTMFTSETKETLCEGMIVPVNIRMVKDDFAIVKLDCGIEGRVEAHEVTYRNSIKEVLHVGQTVQAKILEINRKEFICKLSMREDALRRPYRKIIDHDRGAWDYAQEDDDKEELRPKDRATGRTQRVIKHPLFKPFNSTQAEEYLGSQAPGDVVIRPSGKGNDHLAVTWKVADGVIQHIDVLELQKENEFSVGRLLRIGEKYKYSDLDELIVEHVKGMAKKVVELMQHEKFQKGSKSDLEKWLTTYMDANPNRSVYAFCIDRTHPGYFIICWKSDRNTKVRSWPVKVIPAGYELLRGRYPDMRSLCNGFKLAMMNGPKAMAMR